DPVDIPRGSDALFMLQVIRDEAHRFANKFHRELRGKRMIKSELEGIKGLGDSRAKKLIAEMGGVGGVRSATRADLSKLTWLPRSVAEAVYLRFHPDAQDDA
ncbi:MAG: excinuclease ABC subunit C, partial [Actinomycetota bacterium]